MMVSSTDNVTRRRMRSRFGGEDHGSGVLFKVPTGDPNGDGP